MTIMEAIKNEKAIARKLPGSEEIRLVCFHNIKSLRSLINKGYSPNESLFDMLDKYGSAEAAPEVKNENE